MSVTVCQDLLPDPHFCLPGSDARKAQIAMQVKEETIVSLGWIAERLKMRSAANVSQILGRQRKLAAK